jgi:hypothetical protein
MAWVFFPPLQSGADVDIGSIAVVEADPTILQPGELFDLNNRTLTFTPQSGGGYAVTAGALNFDSSLGGNLGLGDDTSVSQPLSFAFPFFGSSRTTAFINSNGYVTFLAASSFIHFNGQSGGGASTLGDAATVLDRMAEGTPRVAVLWQDWNPAAGGGVFRNPLSDRLIVTWIGVPLFGTSTIAIFQVVLFSNGVIQMNYQSVTTTPGGGYLVGTSPGSSGASLTTTINFSQGGSSVSSFRNFEPLGQVFGSSSAPLVHVSAAARRFYQTHGDNFDQLVMFANFAHAMGDAFAFELTTRQTVSGIGLSAFDNSSFYGSAGRLQSLLNMNRLGVYPNDLACLQNPMCRIPGNNDSVLTLMGQETGHQWLAFVEFDDGGVCSNLLLGRDSSHWSFFHDTDASVMEGNSWFDHGNGTFTTNEDTIRYSALDQYIMGLRPAVEVPSFFFINNPTNTGGKNKSSPPVTGVTVNGMRQNVMVDQIKTCEGNRAPSSGFTGVNPTTNWNQAFILLIPAGTIASQSDLGKIETIASTWVPYFNAATGGRGSVRMQVPTLGLTLNQMSFQSNQTLILTATTTPGATPRAVDAYVAVLLSDGTLLFLQGGGSFTTDFRPIVSNWQVSPFSGEIFRYTFVGGEPVGIYAWVGAFTEPETLNLIGPLVFTLFTFSP